MIQIVRASIFLLLIAVATAAMPTLAADAAPYAIDGISNLYQVSPTLYRSAMPEPEGFAALEGTPIRSILSLRWQADPEDVTPENGPRRLHIPIRTWKLTDGHVVAFLKLATDPSNQPMLVHCKHGADRTGTMIAVYRIVVEGWSKADALREMRNDDYGHHWIWLNLRRYLRNLDVEKIRRAAGLDVFPSIEQKR